MDVVGFPQEVILGCVDVCPSIFQYDFHWWILVDSGGFWWILVDYDGF